MEKNDNIPFFLPSIGKEEEEAVLRIMRSGWLTTGQECLQFEKEFTQKVHAQHSLAVNSATSGLQLAMHACDIKKGTKIITSPYTFVSTATAAIHAGAEVEYVDIENDTYSIDADEIEKKLAKDSSIRAIVPIHIAGNICNMQKIQAIAKHYDVKVIEDAAHAFPAKTQNGYAGTLGDIGVFSFYATKTITTAEGGMICTNNDALAQRMSLMRNHGIDRNVWNRYNSDNASWEYDVVSAGYKYNLPDILAAMGREQLKKADTLFYKRKKIAEYYNEAFKSYDFLQCPPDGDGNAWHLYLLRIRPEKLSVSRNEFAQSLQKNGINISVHFIPHYEFTYFKNRYNLKPDDFANTKKQFESTVSIPLWPDMSMDMAERVVKSIVKIGKNHYNGNVS
ncbi:MAG: DegT/DnrJ/EryC1/StrS aminotransferase family protein [Spirochaetales bacterium]